MSWWKEKKESPKKSRFTLGTRGVPSPDTLVKVNLTETIPDALETSNVSAPQAVNISYQRPIRPIPSPINWLLKSSSSIPDSVTSIDLFSIREKNNPDSYIPEDDQQPRLETSLGISRILAEPDDSLPSLEERLRVLLSIPLEIFISSNNGLEWPSQLMEFQKEGVQALLNNERLLLADDMGLGKTLQTIAALRVLFFQNLIQRVLIITPVSLLDQWRSELAKWAPEISPLIIRGTQSERQWMWDSIEHVNIAMVGYETFLNDFSGIRQDAIKERIWDVVILDEAQRIKNRNSTSYAVKQLKRRRSWALTGTPLENKVDELASIMEFVDHSEDGSPRHYSPGELLYTRHRELQLRRKKTEVMKDLPPKLTTNIKIALTPKQQTSYDRAETEGIVHLRELGQDVTVSHVLELITRLKQICNSDPESQESSKLNDIQERMDQLQDQGHKALIFSQYTNNDSGVGRVITALEKYDPLKLTGNMNPGSRTYEIEKFKKYDKHKVLVISLMAGGQGLNLQEASYVFHLDRWWNPAVEQQAEARAWRFGQDMPVNIIKYTCVNTVEEKIDTILEEKQALFDMYIDDVSIELSESLNRDQLFGLFDIEPPGVKKPKEGRNKGLALEARSQDLLSKIGYKVKTTPISRDGGIDLIASKEDTLGISQELFIQCKDYAKPVGVSVVRELIGSLPKEGNPIAILISPSGVTSDARQAAALGNVSVWDEAKLTELESI